MSVTGMSGPTLDSRGIDFEEWVSVKTSKETTKTDSHGTSNDLVLEWKETVESNHTTGVDPQDLEEILKLDCFNLTNADLVAQFTRTLKKLATSTVQGSPSIPATSTVFGDLDEKTSLFGLFHCSKAPDGTLTISYAISTLATQMSRQGFTAGFQDEPFMMSPVWTTNHLASNVLEKLQSYGVNLTRPALAASGEQGSGAGFPMVDNLAGGQNEESKRQSWRSIVTCYLGSWAQ